MKLYCRVDITLRKQPQDLNYDFNKPVHCELTRSSWNLLKTYFGSKISQTNNYNNLLMM